MSSVKHILEAKGKDVFKIRDSETVFEALEKLAIHDVGALLVADKKDKIVGLFSEREYARKLVLKGKSSKHTKVKDMMKKKLYYVKPENNMWECLDLITNKRIRYLLVVEEEELIGMLSIGDIVYQVITDQKSKIEDLENYIVGSGYGTEIKMPT